MNDLKNQPESYWKERLTPEQYKVVRQRGRSDHLRVLCTITMQRVCTSVWHAVKTFSPQIPSLNQAQGGRASTSP